MYGWVHILHSFGKIRKTILKYLVYFRYLFGISVEGSPHFQTAITSTGLFTKDETLETTYILTIPCNLSKSFIKAIKRLYSWKKF